MTTAYKTVTLTLMAMLMSLLASCSDDFERTGILESRPGGSAGTWVIDGESYHANSDVELDDDDGPLEVGACVEIEGEDEELEEVETTEMSDCK